ncbi:hypothetical protein [Tunicatimonas pelagia]|uniref:hypothetical protein n=1 Tax=Tunicatimonas pelagia TaxID=931531 RepID=UPI0026669A3B|nr:hypothetical protein [Tunicatimonas pelagia]WKN41860.1 hypothetical protein P0M28_22735 [Tunicatimonas pelagia]
MRFTTLRVLLLIYVTLPLTLVGLLVARFVNYRKKITPARQISSSQSAVLITGGRMTKALHLARSFHAIGWRVVLTDGEKYAYCGPKYSEVVSAFRTHLDLAKVGETAYLDSLCKIIIQENIDLVIPVSSPKSSLPDAKLQLVIDAAVKKGIKEKATVVFHGTPEQIGTVDDKFLFCEKASKLGLSSPKVFRMTSYAEVEQFSLADYSDQSFIFKSINYNPTARLDENVFGPDDQEKLLAYARSVDISAKSPWVLQSYIEGREYCTHGTAVNGKLTLFCCCESSAFQVNYAHVHKPTIEQWVATYVGKERLTGQYSFDFIEEQQGNIFPIECNPRTHTAITTFYNTTRLAESYLAKQDTSEEQNLDKSTSVVPEPNAKPTYWLAHELHRIFRPLAGETSLHAVKRIWRGKEAVYDPADPRPFLMLHYVHIPYLLLGLLRRGSKWKRIDFNIGKIVEVGGD